MSAATDLINIDLLLQARTAGMAAFSEAEGGIGGVGKAMLATGEVITAALIGAAAVSTKWAAEFQRDLTMIHTQAGDTTASLTQIGSALEGLSTQVGFGPDELAQSLYHVESAGFRGATAIDMVRQAAELAQVGNANLEDTTQAVVGSLAAFGDQGLTANQAIAILNATVGAGDMRMQGLASSLATGILPAARTVGLQLTDVGAAMATLTDNVTPPEEAATRLRMTFTLLAAGTPAANHALERIGLTSNQLGEDMRKPNGLLVAVQDLKTHLEVSGLTAVEQSDVIARAFGGGRSSAAIETLLSEFDRFKSKYDAINSGAKNFAAAWAETQQTTSFQWKQMQADIQDIGTIAGAVFLPLSTEIMSAVLPALRQFAAFMQGPGIQGLQSIGSHVGIVTGALGTLVSGFQKGHAPGTVLMDTMKQLGVGFQATAPLAGLITDAIQTFQPVMKDAQKAVADFMKEHRADFQAIWATTKQIMNELGPLVEAVLADIQHFWHDHGQQILTIVTDTWGIMLAIVKDALVNVRDVIKLVTDLLRGDWRAVWHDILTVVGDVVAEVVDVVRHLAVLISDVWVDITQGAVNFADSLIIGIVRGIAGGQKAVREALMSVVGGALNDAKHFLGIGSPSKVFADEVGAPIAQGIGLGISKSADNPQSALRALSGSLFGAGASASSALAGVGGGGAGGGVYIDLRGSSVMSDRDMEILAQKLMPAIGRVAVQSGIKFRN